MKKNIIKNIAIYAAIVLVLAAVFYFILSNAQPKVELPKYSDILAEFSAGNVKEFSLDTGNGFLTLTLREKTSDKAIEKDEKIIMSYNISNLSIFYEDVKPHIEKYNTEHPKEQLIYDYVPPVEVPWFLNMLPTIILFIAMGALFFFFMRRMSSGIDGGSKTMNFGKAKYKQVADEKRKTTFADVAGADEEKEELKEIVEFLKSRKKFEELGARVPKGVLLVGPPGTGKTLIARAVAGEAGVPFFSISGSDFVEMFVGVGASRVRDLFEQAKKNAPCIIFIDEIDAVGRHRGAGLGGGHDEREQTLNQLLVEMDGFGVNEGVIMIAATNRPDILDPALMRPGRFDRQVMVGYPDMRGRAAILQVHAKGKPLAPDVDLGTIAKSCSGFTGADLENLLNEAALLSARKNLKAITMEEIEEATIKVVMGTEKRSHVVTEKDKKITSYHEAGHAVATYYLPTLDPVHQISIIPRGMAGGYTMHRPQEDRGHQGKQELLERIVGLLGGRVAESLTLGDVCTGASNDIERATKIAQDMVTKYGMSDRIGTVAFAGESHEVFLGKDYGNKREYSESTATKIDEEISRIVSEAYAKCTDILKTHIDKLNNVALYLFHNEKLDGAKFVDVMENGYIPSAEAQPM